MTRKEKSTVTIYDVARRAGVAISTVSRVLNDSNDVSDKTRSEVEQAIDELRFRPSRTARSLAQQEYHSFAVALPSFTAPFQNELLKGIRSYIREPGLDLLICDLGSKNVEKSLRSFLQRGSVRGLMICGVPLSKSLTDELIDSLSPTVLVGSQSEHFDSFYWDDARGIQLSTEHLLKQGHRELCLICAAIDSEAKQRRIAGFRTALLAGGIEFDDSRIVSGEIGYHSGHSEEDGFDAMQKAFDRFPHITGVVASSDVLAIGAMMAIKDRGCSIPDDVAIVGYDDIKTSRFIGLSSVDLGMQAIGFQAAKQVYGRVKGDILGPPIEHIVQPTLEIRASSLRHR